MNNMISGPFIVMLCTLAVIANEVILNISHEFVGEPQESYDTIYTTKKYYFMTFFKANFFRAYQFCQVNNMELFTIDSKGEEQAFVSYINNKDFQFKDSQHFWSSGTDLGEEGKFFFLSNGRPIGNLTWARNEPDNVKRSDSSETENCMAYTTNDNLKLYRLHDRFCSLKLNFVCQAIISRCSSTFEL